MATPAVIPTCSHPNGGMCRQCQPSMFPTVEREIAYEAWFIAYRQRRTLVEESRAAKPVMRCQREGCERDVLARGLCRAHYKRVWRRGGFKTGFQEWAGVPVA